MECLFTVEACQGAGEKYQYGFNWTLRLARLWLPNSPFAAGVRVRPSAQTLQTGFEYESSGGQSSGAAEPRWPTRAGATVRDGSITWTAVVLSEDSLLERIAESDWDVPTGLEGSGPDVVATAGSQSTQIALTAGAEGETYTVVNEIRTTAGNEYQAVIALTIA